MGLLSRDVLFALTSKGPQHSRNRECGASSTSYSQSNAREIRNFELVHHMGQKIQTRQNMNRQQPHATMESKKNKVKTVKDKLDNDEAAPDSMVYKNWYKVLWRRWKKKAKRIANSEADADSSSDESISDDEEKIILHIKNTKSIKTHAKQKASDSARKKLDKHFLSDENLTFPSSDGAEVKIMTWDKVSYSKLTPATVVVSHLSSPSQIDKVLSAGKAGSKSKRQTAGTKAAGQIAGTKTAGQTAGTKTAGQTAGTKTAGQTAGSKNAGPITDTNIAGQIRELMLHIGEPPAESQIVQTEVDSSLEIFKETENEMNKNNNYIKELQKTVWQLEADMERTRNLEENKQYVHAVKKGGFIYTLNSISKQELCINVFIYLLFRCQSVMSTSPSMVKLAFACHLQLGINLLMKNVPSEGTADTISAGQTRELLERCQAECLKTQKNVYRLPEIFRYTDNEINEKTSYAKELQDGKISELEDYREKTRTLEKYTGKLMVKNAAAEKRSEQESAKIKLYRNVVGNETCRMMTSIDMVVSKANHLFGFERTHIFFDLLDDQLFDFRSAEAIPDFVPDMAESAVRQYVHSFFEQACDTMNQLMTLFLGCPDSEIFQQMTDNDFISLMQCVIDLSIKPKAKGRKKLSFGKSTFIMVDSKEFERALGNKIPRDVLDRLRHEDEVSVHMLVDTRLERARLIHYIYFSNNCRLFIYIPTESGSYWHKVDMQRACRIHQHDKKFSNISSN